MATKTKAELISADKLSSAVDKAVRIAAERHGIDAGDKNLILNWDLIGRVVRDADKAGAFAKDVTTAVSTATGQKLQPATVQIGKQIWCGFFEKNRIPVSRDFF
jgi:hypothetical protein